MHHRLFVGRALPRPTWGAYSTLRPKLDLERDPPPGDKEGTHRERQEKREIEGKEKKERRGKGQGSIRTLLFPISSPAYQ